MSSPKRSQPWSYRLFLELGSTYSILHCPWPASSLRKHLVHNVHFVRFQACSLIFSPSIYSLFHHHLASSPSELHTTPLHSIVLPIMTPSASTTRLTLLATSILESVAKLEEMLLKQGFPSPTFDEEAPTLLPKETVQVRDSIIDAAAEVQDLLQGPLDILYRHGSVSSCPRSQDGSRLYQSLSIGLLISESSITACLCRRYRASISPALSQLVGRLHLQKLPRRQA